MEPIRSRPRVPVCHHRPAAPTSLYGSHRCEADDCQQERADFVSRIYESHGDCLLKYVGRLLPGDPQGAEDIVQETFLRAWSHFPALESQQGTPRPWLFTVARNLVIDSVRRRRARPYEVSAEELTELPDEELLDNALLAQLLADALSQLVPAHREVLVHMHYWGRSGPETAALLGVPPGTVKSRMHKAVRAMRTVLYERGVSGTTCL
ncbi:RNA polymerase sigma-70 factor (ECF subfamily) [Streptomyces sp. TLI_235]|nr:sigma-70 family RNA polymerase sigma factor [Streptomyces sp. TLI_235]PBC69569.1 RNA polymerase sigma-70 factor (ECF subfamily) [Streptomyces sp. TLI_235]